jgi:hypothetical protein
MPASLAGNMNDLAHSLEWETWDPNQQRLKLAAINQLKKIRSMLLIVDNAETLRPGQKKNIVLRSATKVRILVTSKRL